MKIVKTNAELDRMYSAIKTLSGTDISLPVKAGYMLAKLRVALENALKPYKESTVEIIKKYSKNGEDTLRVSKEEDPDTYDKVLADVSEIGNEVSELDVTPIPIELFEGHDIPFAIIDSLSCCIEGGDE